MVGIYRETAGRRWEREARSCLVEERQGLDPEGQPGVKKNDAGLKSTLLFKA